MRNCSRHAAAHVEQWCVRSWLDVIADADRFEHHIAERFVEAGSASVRVRRPGGDDGRDLWRSSIRRSADARSRPVASSVVASRRGCRTVRTVRENAARFDVVSDRERRHAHRHGENSRMQHLADMHIEAIVGGEHGVDIAFDRFDRETAKAQGIDDAVFGIRVNEIVEPARQVGAEPLQRTWMIVASRRRLIVVACVPWKAMLRPTAPGGRSALIRE